MISFNSFSTLADMAMALADDVEKRLTGDLEARGKALWLVSGGSTPKPLFEEMATRDLDWANITIALVDERFVPETHPRSNTAFVKDSLLKDKAAKAGFIPLYEQWGRLSDAAKAANVRYKNLPTASSILLGLGPDGHTASFFPNAAGLSNALDAETDKRVVAVQAQQSAVTGDEVERLTITEPVITACDHVTLMIKGAEKRDVLEKALESSSDLPIAFVINSITRPLQVYWTP